MPFGLVNAPAIFQDFMHHILCEFLHKFVLVYIDDILIFSKDPQDHFHVVEVLERLREHQLFLKAEKCSFQLSSIQFLGYNIFWPIPKTIKKRQRFLGFANFYLRSIKNFSATVTPLTNPLRGKPRTLSWPQMHLRS